MANMLQSSQNKETTAPSYYTDYLSNLATAGKAAACGAQYVGAQPLQTKAFEAVNQNFGAQQPGITAGQNLVGQAAGQDVTGAAAPYLQAGTTASPLSAAQPLICQSANLNIACLASQYMSPYIQTAVQGLSDVAHRNIRNNLSPAATAAAVGSGQFGSQRGAQVLGQVQAQAEQCLNAQIANMQNQGFAQALQAATAKQNALGSLAGTTANAQQAQNQANLTAGQTAAQAAANEGQLLNTAGTNMGNLAQTGAGMNLACINALSTLGGQQQTIGQNEENFPLTKLASLGSLLQGYSIPVGTKTTLCMSPLSGLAAVGSGALGMVTPKYDSNGNVIKDSSPVSSIYNAASGFGKWFDKTFSSDPSSSTTDPNADYYDPVYDDTTTTEDPWGDGGFTVANGGLIQANCSGLNCNANMICTPFMARGGHVGQSGCASTAYRGALPYRKG